MWTNIKQQNTWRLWYANIFLHSTLYPPNPVAVTTSIITCLLGSPNLNLHLWLASWVGGRSNLYMSYNSFISNSWTNSIHFATITNGPKWLAAPRRLILWPVSTPVLEASSTIVFGLRLVERLSFLKLHTLKQGQIPENARKNHWE